MSQPPRFANCQIWIISLESHFDLNFLVTFRMSESSSSVSHLIPSLSKSQRMYTFALRYLIQCVADVGPSTAIPILTPICYLAARFDESIRCVMLLFHTLFIRGQCCIAEDRGGLESKYFCELLDVSRQARYQLVPAIEANLVDIGPLLLSKLRGPHGLERLLRFLKQIPGFWSGRIDLLDDILDIMSSICSSGRTIGDCLEHFERYTCVMKARFLDQDWVVSHQGRPDLIWCLYGTGELVMEQLYGMSWDPKLTRFLPDGTLGIISDDNMTLVESPWLTRDNDTATITSFVETFIDYMDSSNELSITSHSGNNITAKSFIEDYTVGSL
ncbi:uncharacterized protein ARMOST_18056 [Armillaria ostoyae]|uniref:Uncharacterized protein n=1 Tax=Armillaria ostoyae TaxID=47428 RepID=A0A284S0R9_ARMOS|nr:uncharacterized protein ARMOST_18056 [Armillaria ostoyae]